MADDALQNALAPDQGAADAMPGMAANATADPMDMLGQLTDLHGKMLDNQTKQVQNQSTWQRLKSKDTLSTALSSFLFSLGRGMQASAQYPGARGGVAGMGAALQGPAELQQLQQQKQMRQAQINDIQQQAQLRQQQAQRIPLVDPTTGQPMLDGTGQPLMVDPKTAGNIQLGLRRVQATSNIANDKEAWNKEKAKQLNEQFYLKQGYQINGWNADGTPQIEPLPDSQLPASIQVAREKEQRQWYEQGMKMDYSQYPPKPVPIPEDDPSFPIRIKLKQQEDQDRQNYQQELMGYRNAVQTRNTQQLALSQQRLNQSAGKLANDVFDPAMESDTRLRSMLDAAGDNFQGKGGQSDLSLIFNHIGMTLSAQKGARINNAEIERAIKTPGQESGPIQRLVAMYNYVEKGQLLTADQRKEMVQNGVERRQNLWDVSRRKAQLDQLPQEPSPDITLPPLQRQTVSPLPNPNQGASAVPRGNGGGMVRMQKPDGTVVNVPTAQVPAALKLGGKMMQ